MLAHSIDILAHSKQYHSATRPKLYRLGRDCKVLHKSTVWALPKAISLCIQYCSSLNVTLYAWGQTMLVVVEFRYEPEGCTDWCRLLPLGVEASDGLNLGVSSVPVHTGYRGCHTKHLNSTTTCEPLAHSSLSRTQGPAYFPSKRKMKWIEGQGKWW